MRGNYIGALTPEGEKKTGRSYLGESAPEVIIRVNLPSYALQPRNDTAVRAHCGRADQESEMDPRSRSRLVERTAVGEGG